MVYEHIVSVVSSEPTSLEYIEVLPDTRTDWRPVEHSYIGVLIRGNLPKNIQTSWFGWTGPTRHVTLNIMWRKEDTQTSKRVVLTGFSVLHRYIGYELFSGCEFWVYPKGSVFVKHMKCRVTIFLFV